MGYKYRAEGDRKITPDEIEDYETAEQGMSSTDYGFDFFTRGKIVISAEEFSTLEDFELALYRMLKGLKLRKDVNIDMKSEDGEGDYKIQLTPSGEMFKSEVVREFGPWKKITDYDDDDWEPEESDEDDEDE